MFNSYFPSSSRCATQSTNKLPTVARVELVRADMPKRSCMSMCPFSSWQIVVWTPFVSTAYIPVLQTFFKSWSGFIHPLWYSAFCFIYLNSPTTCHTGWSSKRQIRKVGVSNNWSALGHSFEISGKYTLCSCSSHAMHFKLSWQPHQPAWSQIHRFGNNWWIVHIRNHDGNATFCQLFTEKPWVNGEKQQPCRQLFPWHHAILMWTTMYLSCLDYLDWRIHESFKLETPSPPNAASRCDVMTRCNIHIS